MTSGNITNTVSPQEITCFSPPQAELSPAASNWTWSQSSSDKMSFWVFGVTNSSPTITITFAYNGTTTCSHVETPKQFLVDSSEIEADHDSIVLNYNVISPLYLSNTPMPWSIPWKAKYILDAQIMFFANGATSTADIDLTTNYTNDPYGAINQYTSTDTTTLYKIVGPDLVNRLSFLSLIPNAQRDTIGTIVFTKNDMSPAIYITKIKIYYYY
jgi:hypothetical protein